MFVRVAIYCLYLLSNFNNAEKTVGLILARGGSRGIRLKNLQLVGSVSLLQRTIHTARSAGIHDLVVSTDHPLIALHALKAGANIFHRSRITASDWAPSIWGVAEYIHFQPTVSAIVLLQATSPFTHPISIRKALTLIRSHDCVFSTTRPRRQEWDGELLETGAFYVTRRHLIEQGYFQNNNCAAIEVSQYESYEVDTHYDLKLANILDSTL